MFSFLETLVILIVAVLVFGPKRLPEVARKVGNWMGMLRRASDEFKQQLMTMDQAVEDAVSVPDEDLDNLLPNEQDFYGTDEDGERPAPSQDDDEPYVQPPPPQGEDETSPDAAAAWLDGTDDEDDMPEAHFQADAVPTTPENVGTQRAAETVGDARPGEADPAAAEAAASDVSASAAEAKPAAPRRPTLTPTLTPTRTSAAKEAAHV